MVKAAYDDEAQVWYVESSDLPGLNVEADSLEELIAKLSPAVQDDEGGLEGLDLGVIEGEIPIELIAHASSRVRLREVA
jgi:predicted RNase H-like HicB family nuclease